MHVWWPAFPHGVVKNRNTQRKDELRIFATPPPSFLPASTALFCSPPFVCSSLVQPPQAARRSRQETLHQIVLTLTSPPLSSSPTLPIPASSPYGVLSPPSTTSAPSRERSAPLTIPNTHPPIHTHTRCSSPCRSSQRFSCLVTAPRFVEPPGAHLSGSCACVGVCARADRSLRGILETPLCQLGRHSDRVTHRVKETRDTPSNQENVHQLGDCVPSLRPPFALLHSSTRTISGAQATQVHARHTPHSHAPA